jgi:prephenate dehydratase
VIVDEPGQLGKVSSVLGEMNIDIRKVEMIEANEEVIKFVFSVLFPHHTQEKEIEERLCTINGIKQINFSKAED